MAAGTARSPIGLSSHEQLYAKKPGGVTVLAHISHTWHYDGNSAGPTRLIYLNSREIEQ